ncbi:hypothetical protein ACLB1Q_35975 [Escherichia coli]
MRTTSSILCVIASFIAAGKNQISMTELVILSGISRQSVKRAIQTLEQAGGYHRYQNNHQRQA